MQTRHFILPLFLLIPSFLSAQVYETFYPDGSLKSRTALNDKGQREGVAQHFFPGGALSGEVPYLEDQRQGTAKTYFPDGTLQSVSPYVGDQRHGIATTYDSSGIILQTQMWQNDRKEGDLKIYFQSGGLQFYGLTTRDSLLFSQRFNEQGLLIEEQYQGLFQPLDTLGLPEAQYYLAEGDSLAPNQQNPVSIFIPEVPSQLISFSSPSGEIERNTSPAFPLKLSPHPGEELFVVFLRIKVHPDDRPVLFRRLIIPVTN